VKYTIIELVHFPNGKYYYHELESDFKSTFDDSVEDCFHNPFRKATYLVARDGRLIDSYVKD
jgi:hypothetical protein